MRTPIQEVPTVADSSVKIFDVNEVVITAVIMNAFGPFIQESRIA